MHPNDGRVVSNFILQALNNRDITVFGDGSQSRSFCFVDDLIEGFVCMMAAPDDFIGPVNLGNPNEFSILELAEKIINLTASTAKIIHQPLPADDPLQRQPNITLAKRQLGWEPKIQLEEGLRRTIAYFKENL
jgi:UDP-glucuronate decarboxylase